MDMTPAEWWSALGQVALVIVISFVVLCLITSLVRFQLMTEKAAEADELGAGEEKNFRLNIVNQIAIARKARLPISVVLLRLPPDGASATDVEARLRPHLRADDIITVCGENLLGLLLLCGSENVGAVVGRLMAPDAAGAIPGADRWRFGVAGYPEHGFKASVLYPRALAMMDEAERTGVRAAGMAAPEAVADDKNAPADMLDPLTGLIREEKMIHVMRRFIAQERKAERPVSLAYLDVDQLDRVVEQVGAPQVPALIKELAGFLGRGFREKDMLCRFGDAGFVVGMPAAPWVAATVVQRVMADVRKYVFKTGAGTKLTLGAGVAGYPDVQGTAVHYFVAAEQALHQAKTRGRHQLVKYDPASMTESTSPKTIDRL